MINLVKHFVTVIVVIGVLTSGCAVSSDGISAGELGIYENMDNAELPEETILKTPTVPSSYMPLALKDKSAAEMGRNQDETSPQDIDAWVEATLAEMTLEQKIGQMILTGVDGDQITEETCQYMQWLMPGGITFQHGNIKDPEQLRTFVEELQRCVQETQSVPMLMAVSHEGEYAHRYLKGATVFPAALALGAVDDPNAAGQVAYAAGQELAYSGISMVLGPVADVLDNYDNDVISQRTFGGDTQLVSQYVAQAVTGYRQGGVIPVLKHFPGHGGVAQDSHQVLPVDPVDIKTLRAEYLPPFRAGLDAGAPVIMLSHIAFPAINGGEIPSTLSPEMIQFVRQEMDFDGVILSDSLRMKSVTDNKAVGAWEVSVDAAMAGIDMLLLNWTENSRVAKEFLLAAYERGELTEERIDEAVRRILTLKASWGLSKYPIASGPTPNWQADQELSYYLGERAVALYKDEAELVPIPGQAKRILIIGPGTDWKFYPVLQAALNQRGHETTLANYPPPWEGPVVNPDLLNMLTVEAQYYDLVLVFTWQAHLNRLVYNDPWQADLLTRLATTRPTIAVAIKSPTDILEFPNVAAYLAMFGSTPGQTEALLNILLGRQAATGVNPLPGLIN